MTQGPSPEVAAVRPGEELEWERLATYLRANVEGLGPLESASQFPNGSANLTYLLHFSDRELVVRRPPFGEVAPGAHDMKREYRALSRLWRHYPRAPRAYLLCQDHGVVGSDFLVLEYRRGIVIWNALPAALAVAPDAGRRIALAVVDALADLHRLDPDDVGVADLGRAEGFVERQLTGWRQRWAATSKAATMPLIDDVARALVATKPESVRRSIIHNDFKIDNCQFRPHDPDRVISVFDWDMATLGDPMVDLGILLNYWPDPSDRSEEGPVHPVGLQTMGLPTRSETVEQYAAVSGADVSSVGWYEAFGCWKTAIVLAQLHDRYVRGDSHDDRQAAKVNYLVPLARRAQAILDRR